VEREEVEPIEPIFGLAMMVQAIDRQ
jgi:hypothetical protein